MKTIQVEVILNDGSKTTIMFEGSEQEFKDRISFDTGTFFLQNTQGYYILVKSISQFKFQTGAN